MRHIRIQQETTSSENVSKNVISKLYEIYKDNFLDLDSESILKGRIDSNYVYDVDYDYFINKFNNFIINYNVDKLIRFRDPLVETIFRNNNKYDVNADGITYSYAALQSQVMPTIFMDSNIGSFDELKLFNYNRSNWGYWSIGGFTRCTYLMSIDLIKFNEISNAMFEGCTNLQIVKNFTGNYVGWNGLSGCPNLETVNLSNVKNLSQGQFAGSTKLNIIANGYDFSKIETFDSTTQAYKGLTLGSFEANFSNLKPNNQGQCHISYAFYQTPAVTAIYGNQYFTSISSVDNSWCGYIHDCDNLIKIDFSMCILVTKVQRHLCTNCNSIKIIKLPSTIEKIYNAPFGYNNEMSTIKAWYLPVVTPPSIYSSYDCSGDPSNEFYRTYNYANDLKIYVPSSSISTYESTAGWDAFTGKYYSLEQFTIDYPND